ncbi:MAG: C40 family peptidase [Lachnospiraceae bacterium]|nr:C40 family peptidase [Lachnospiraceae bacterium]
MRHSKIGKLTGICLLSTVMLFGTANAVHAVNVSGTDAAAGGTVALETYYRNSSSTIQANSKTVTSAPVLEKVPGYDNLGIANVQDSLNIRSNPENGKIVGRLLKNGACEVLSYADGWYFIESGEIMGYVSGEYLLTGDEALERAWEVMANVATVKADALYLREQPSTESDIVDVLGNSEQLEVVEQLEGWAKVVVDNVEGYVSTDYITIAQELQTARTLAELIYGMDVSELRVEMAEFAQQFVGCPYVYGGNSLTNGTDCSGFTNLIYAHFGISIPRTASTQYRFFNKISASELKPGDLVFYPEPYDPNDIGHVAMYIGNGQVVHASNPRTGIKYSQMDYRTIAGFGRIIQD